MILYCMTWLHLIYKDYAQRSLPPGQRLSTPSPEKIYSMSVTL